MPILQDLVFCYEFEDADGASAVDAHGGFDLTDHNGATHAAGVVNNAVSLASASSQYYHVAHNSALAVQNGMTIAAWVYIASTGDRVIWQKNGSNLSITGSPAFSFYGAGDAVQIAGYSLSTWYFLVGTKDGSGTNLWLNNSTNVSNGNGTAPTDAGESMYVGSNVGVNSFWNGRIDQLMFWHRVISSDERAYLYNSGAGRSYAEMVSEGALHLEPDDGSLLLLEV